MKIFIFFMLIQFRAVAKNIEYIEVPIFSLITSPDSFNEKSIMVQGVLDIRKEYSYLYVTKDYFDSKISSGRIKLKISSIPDLICHANGEFVKVFGNFHSITRNAEGGTYFIDDIYRISIFNSVLYPSSHKKYGKGAIKLFEKRECAKEQ